MSQSVQKKFKMTKVKSCLICKNKKLKLSFVKNGYCFFECRKCKFIFVNPRPSEKTLARLYTKDFFLGDYNDNYKNSKKFLEGTASFYERSKKTLENIEKYISTGNLIDIGCGMGFLLKTAVKSGWKAKGVEVSIFAVKKCRADGLDVDIGTIENANLGVEKYNVVTAQDVLEHVYNPKHFVVRAMNLLKKDGLLIVEVPNNDSVTAKREGVEWSQYIPPIHLNFFNSENLRLLLENNGFTVIRSESQLSVSIGFRNIIRRVVKNNNNLAIKKTFDYADHLTTVFKKNLFYPPINFLFKKFMVEGDLLVLYAAKK